MSAPDAVSIIIPAFNQLDYCRACIDSIDTHTRWPHRLILVDNGSTVGVGEYFESLSDRATVVHTEENLGFSGGVNAGLLHASGHVLLLNSDTLVTPHWLTRLVQVLEAEGLGMTGPVSNRVAGPQQLDGLEQMSSEEAVDFALQRATTHSGQHTLVNRLVGFCMLIHRDVATAVGTFDERFETGNFEDDDYCTRVRQLGHGLAIVEDSFVYHHGGRTMAAMGLSGTAYHELMERNRQRYEAKWRVTLPREQFGTEAREAHQAAAQAALDRGDAQGAIAALQEAIAAEPEAAGPYRDLGLILLGAGQQALARKCFQQAWDRDVDLDGLADLIQRCDGP